MNTTDLFTQFLQIIKRLRDPETGCPWDLKQTHESLKPYVIEEAYELVEAIDQGPDALRDELGDLLLQVGLHRQIAADAGYFTINEVLHSQIKKLIDRHPHVFGDSAADTAEKVSAQWESVKSKGRAPDESILASIPNSLPALIRAQKISKRAAANGFEWQDIRGIRDKILEEVAEFAEAATMPEASPDHIKDEFGDILFCLVQLARRYGFDAEEALQRTNRRFIERFRRLETQAQKPLEQLNDEEWQILWKEAKDHVRKTSY
jgi:tetrapyrrole methylase family protein/MazG family protein